MSSGERKINTRDVAGGIEATRMTHLDAFAHQEKASFKEIKELLAPKNCPDNYPLEAIHQMTLGLLIDGGTCTHDHTRKHVNQ